MMLHLDNGPNIFFLLSMMNFACFCFSPLIFRLFSFISINSNALFKNEVLFAGKVKVTVTAFFFLVRISHSIQTKFAFALNAID